MKRFPWDILLALLLGLGFGVVYSWLIAPQGTTNTKPTILRADFKDAYRSAIAAAFAATGNLPRAQARLELLGDSDSASALDSQAQRMIASGTGGANGEFTQADQLAALSQALKNGYAYGSIPTPTTEIVALDPSETLPPAPQDLPFQLTETPLVADTQVTDIPSAETQVVQTQPVAVNPTARPTRTLIPTVGAPFALTAQDTVCDSNLPDGLLQVFVFNSAHRQVAGAKIIVAWENGEDAFFTGFKPEVGNGYADYLMTPNINYTLRLAAGSDIATGLIVPTCQTSSGEAFLGGIKLTFQQP
jgi:hypothetical protein